MKYRPLGKTGLKVSEIGFGTWQLANDPGIWTGSNLKESMKCLYEYVERGGNFIDTAWVYGYSPKRPNVHASEQLIGKFLKESGLREKLVIATKVPPKNFRWPAEKNVPIRDIFPDDWIEKCVNDSTRNLGVDRIDLVQFHVWNDDFAAEKDWKKVVQKITDEGKVSHWGISANDYQPDNCLKTLDTGLIGTVQFIFNVFHQKPVKLLFPYARKHNIGLIARVPLDEGGLSGKITENTKFSEGDFRDKYFTPERRKELVERIRELEAIMGGEAKSVSELALRYILSFDEISTLITGMRKLEYVRNDTAVSDGRKLSKKLMEKLKKHSWERNFYPTAASTLV